LARASALHAEGHRFDSDILHFLKPERVVIITDVAVKAAMWFNSTNITMICRIVALAHCGIKSKVL
jgi:hypothetical protein